MDYWYSILREMDNLQSKFLFSKGPSLNEADTVRPNFPLQFQWRANWLLTQCSLRETDTMLSEFLWLCWHNVLSEKLTENLLFSEGLANFAVTISLNKVRKELIESLSIFFSVNFMKGPHSVTKLPVMGDTLLSNILFQWRVDCSFSEGLTDTLLSILLQQCRVHTLLSNSFSEGMTLCCQTLSVKGWHFAVRLFQSRDDTLLSDSFGEGMTLCCQTLLVKGWHFAVRLFQWRDDTLLSDSFSEGMTLCCQTLSVKGWHFAVKLFWWRDDTLLSDFQWRGDILLSNSFSEGMTLCCQSFSSSNKLIDILLPNFLFHWRVNWHYAVKLFFTETWLTLSCQTLSFSEEQIDTLLPNILFQWRADWHSAAKHSLSVKSRLTLCCQTFSFSEEQIDTLLSNILFQRRVDWQFDVIFFPLSEGITLLSNLLYQRMDEWHLTVTRSLQQRTEHFAVISFGFLPFSAKADALPSTFLSRCNEPNWWNHFFTLCYPLKKKKPSYSHTQYSATFEPKSHTLGSRRETAISGMRALHFTAGLPTLRPFLMQ